MTVGSACYMSGLFRVPLEAARRLMPDTYFRVAEIFPDEAVFFVGTGDFQDCPIGPYREMYLGFYTENREHKTSATVEENLAEFTRNESKMYMWKNWVTTDAAMEKMDRAGSTVFRRGEIERSQTGSDTTFIMSHPNEGGIRFTAPRYSEQSQTDFNMQRTHYGRLHDIPSRCLLDLNLKTMMTSLGQGHLELTGPLAEDCADLGPLHTPMVAIWIDEMDFDMHKAVQLPSYD
ncbi:MAG: hypothetical protein VX252_16460 [Myxococcota bacterium]|nr:hypothetical protein [Myxococcota bacterium]